MGGYAEAMVEADASTWTSTIQYGKVRLWSDAGKWTKGERDHADHDGRGNVPPGLRLQRFS